MPESDGSTIEGFKGDYKTTWWKRFIFVVDNGTYEHVDDSEGINNMNINNINPEGNINPGVHSHGSR